MGYILTTNINDETHWFFFSFLAIPWHMEFPSQGPDPSCSCNLSFEARNQTLFHRHRDNVRSLTAEPWWELLVLKSLEHWQEWTWTGTKVRATKGVVMPRMLLGSAQMARRLSYCLRISGALAHHPAVKRAVPSPTGKWPHIRPGGPEEGPWEPGETSCWTRRHGAGASSKCLLSATSRTKFQLDFL